MNNAMVSLSVLSGIGAIFGGLYYLGVFKSVKLKKDRLDAMTLLCENGTGPYKTVGEVFARIIAFCKENGLSGVLSAGMYFDDPETTSAEDCRWCVGVLLDQRELKHVNMNIAKDVLIKENLLLRKVPKTNTVSSVFPLICPPICFMLAVNKIYSMFKKQKEYKLQCGSFEVYDQLNKTITIHFPMENQKQFLPNH